MGSHHRGAGAMNDRHHDFAMTTYAILYALENLRDATRERDNHLLLPDLPTLRRANDDLAQIIKTMEQRQ